MNFYRISAYLKVGEDIGLREVKYEDVRETPKMYVFIDMKGKTKRVLKETECMKPLTLLKNIVSGENPIIGYHTFCLEGQREEAREMLSKKVFRVVHKLYTGASGLRDAIKEEEVTSEEDEVKYYNAVNQFLYWTKNFNGGELFELVERIAKNENCSFDHLRYHYFNVSGVITSSQVVEFYFSVKSSSKKMMIDFAVDHYEKKGEGAMYKQHLLL